MTDLATLAEPELRELAEERRPFADRTDRAKAAHRELQRRTYDRQDEAVVSLACDVLRAAGGSIHWGMHIHPRTWEQWAEAARVALATPGFAGLRCALHNNCGITVSVMPRGSGWTFWPPYDDPAPPPELHDLAWALARRCTIMGD